MWLPLVYSATSHFATVLVSLRQFTTTSDIMASAAPEDLTENREGLAASGDTGTPVEDTRTPGAAARDKPVCLIVLGMAGSGKTTFVQVS